MNILIGVANRVATPPSDAVIVCGNSDYTLTFNFDAEWSAETTRIARFVWFSKNKTYSEEITFEGDTVNAPILTNTNAVYVGVYAGNLRTTTPAKIVCEPSILCYGQDANMNPGDLALIKGQIANLVEALKSINADPAAIKNAVTEYLTQNPPEVTETDPTVPAWAKQSQKPKYTAAEVGALAKSELSSAVNTALAQAKISGEFKGDPGKDYVLTEADRAEIAELVVKLVDTGSKATIGVAELLADKWVGSGNLYSQIVTIDGVTENSQVDLTPSVEQLVVFYEKDLTFVTENEDGIVTVYAIGQKPTNDYMIQVTITEVSV